jgi:glutathione peroxidase
MIRRCLPGLSVVCLLTFSAAFGADEKPEPKAEKAVPAALKFKMKSLDGKEVDLSKYHGKVVLMVNVASQCGATPQYEPLEALNKKYKDQGLVVLGFPCNQFGAQEPGTAEEIREFCTDNYGVTFDLFEKVDVNGEQAAPLYKFLTAKETNPKFAGKIGWNFEKFLIGRDGQVAGRFKTGISPDQPEVVEAIETELKKE